MQPIKLSEPLKSVEMPNKNLDNARHSNAQNTEDKQSFQSMLDKQVQNSKPNNQPTDEKQTTQDDGVDLGEKNHPKESVAKDNQPLKATDKGISKATSGAKVSKQGHLNAKLNVAKQTLVNDIKSKRTEVDDVALSDDEAGTTASIKLPKASNAKVSESAEASDSISSEVEIEPSNKVAVANITTKSDLVDSPVTHTKAPKTSVDELADVKQSPKIKLANAIVSKEVVAPNKTDSNDSLADVDDKKVLTTGAAETIKIADAAKNNTKNNKMDGAEATRTAAPNAKIVPLSPKVAEVAPSINTNEASDMVDTPVPLRNKAIKLSSTDKSKTVKKAADIIDKKPSKLTGKEGEVSRMRGSVSKTEPRTTDFLQTSNQYSAVNHNPVHVHRDAPAAFKAFNSVQAMSDTAQPIAQTLTSAQTTAPVNTLASVGIAANALAASNQINVPFSNQTGWNQAISQKALYMIGRSEQTATLTLNPPDLGPLQVVINVNNEKADTTFISDNADVRQALEDGMENLRDKMGDAGIDLGQANVNDGQQYVQNRDNEGESADADSNISNGETLTSGQAVTRESNGLVDTFA